MKYVNCFACEDSVSGLGDVEHATMLMLMLVLFLLL